MTMGYAAAAGVRGDRLFYTGMGVALAAVVFAGFAPSYYLRPAGLPPMSPMLHLHGIVFTLWMALFIVQAGLVGAGRTDIHRKLGAAGAALALGMVVLGAATAVGTLRAGRGPGGIDPLVFFALPTFDIIIFALLVGSAVALRRKPDWHKRLMLLATISMLTPALGRLVGQFGPPAFIGVTLLFVLAAWAYDFASRGRLHPAHLRGGLLILLGKPLALVVAATPPWLAFAAWVKG